MRRSWYAFATHDSVASSGLPRLVRKHAENTICSSAKPRRCTSWARPDGLTLPLLCFAPFFCTACRTNNGLARRSSPGRSVLPRPSSTMRQTRACTNPSVRVPKESDSEVCSKGRAACAPNEVWFDAILQFQMYNTNVFGQKHHITVAGQDDFDKQTSEGMRCCKFCAPPIGL